ncbi:MAG: peptidase M14, partial [Kofleriaceae bacterium]|nr:peptidase M14 [Kofleriaceae bacterium]
DVSAQSRPFEFKGYQLTREASALSTATWTHYDERKPAIWTIPLFDQFVPLVTVTAPTKGYFIDGGFAKLVEPLLRCHGIQYQPATIGRPLAVQTFRPEKIAFDNKSYEGRQRVTLTGSWQSETRVLTPGALWIPIAQPMARLVLNLFEPTARDALVNWGLFNTVFEQKEYMEDYVAEQVARDMLAANPALQIEFDAKVASDSAFAQSPEARLDFFRRRHPSWDERFNLVPVFRAP